MVVEGAQSDWVPFFFSSVPQDTVLVPLLFSLYINDISTDIEWCTLRVKTRNIASRINNISLVVFLVH